jgi:hypothetical protein
MPIFVTQSGVGSAVMKTSLAALRELADAEDQDAILTRLGHGERVPVTLSDGTKATWEFAGDEPQLPLAGGSARLRRFQAQCTLSFDLPLLVQYDARDKEQAMEMIDDVLGCHGVPPGGFEILVDQDDVEDVVSRLTRAVAKGRPDLLPNAAFAVHDIDELHLLEYAS